MNHDPDRLYDLLPAVYRQRDAAEGWPLRALLRVIAEQLEVLEDDVAQLYENWFVETCEDWVVPYIGDLVGYLPVAEAGLAGDPASEAGRRRNRWLVPRSEVANTVRYRRRKGTLALLEELANGAGWPARAVEFCRLLAHTCDIRLGLPVADRRGTALPPGLRPAPFRLPARPPHGGTADLRWGDALDLEGGPFDRLAHTADVRRIASQHRRGLYNRPNVGLWLFPLEVYSVTGTPARYLDPDADPHFTFSILGNDTPLYRRPEPESGPTSIAAEPNLPVPIRRRALAERPGDLYGPDKSFAIWVRSADGRCESVPVDDVVAADLSGWSYAPAPGKVAVDPELGRIAFYEAPGGDDVDQEIEDVDQEIEGSGKAEEVVWVSYHYAFSTDIGGGEYRRQLAPAAEPYRVGAEARYKTLNQALKALGRARSRTRAVIEIVDSGVYTEQVHIRLKAGQNLELRATDGARPVIRLLDMESSRLDALRVTVPRPRRGEPPAVEPTTFTLDGILVTGRGLEVRGPLRRLVLRHSTLVPGWPAAAYPESEHEVRASLVLHDTRARVEIRRSILGSIQVEQDEVATDPIAIRISDSILDAHERHDALGGPRSHFAHAVLTVERSTVIGNVRAHAVELAENSLFLGAVHVVRAQRGCIRYCYLEPGEPESRTPRRYRCQPDLVEQAVGGALADEEQERSRVRPRLESRCYGAPDYCRLAPSSAEEIRRGADDASEMGVFHDLYEPQRLAHLRARLEEYTPADAEAAVLYAS